MNQEELSVLLLDDELKTIKNCGWKGKTYKYKNYNVVSWSPMMQIFDLKKDNGFLFVQNKSIGKSSEDSFVKACLDMRSNSNTNTLVNVESSLKSYGAKYDLYAKKVVTAIDDYEKRKIELTKILEMDKVVDVKLRPQDDEIEVYTDTLTCTFFDRNKIKYQRVLGHFKIIFKTNYDPNGWDADPEEAIHIYNLKRRVIGYDGSACSAPHVFHSGGICTGNVGDMIHKLLADKKFSVLVSTIIGFLESSNDHDIHNYFVCKWPKVGETEAQYKKRLGFCYCDEVDLADFPEDGSNSDLDDLCSGACHLCKFKACKCIEDCSNCKKAIRSKCPEEGNF